MREYVVAAYVNVDRDAFDGYKASHPLATADDLTFRVDAPTDMDAAERAWVIGQRMDADLDDRRWPADVRSSNVGDVFEVQDGDAKSFFVCEPADWRALRDLPNPLVPIEGTRATSRI
ncbi:hypothetical protein [Actinoallomurus sp. NPDC052274]|uniref:hypothetical protein n=1 Tax=Actinoallomurus sp. NPDC052274 TaxID=3155420 RepID=UPI00343998D5